jgi:23S rRNA (cytosine1962-C5)-methyltransferase
MSTVIVNKRGANRVRQGHLWIYRSDVVSVDAEGGAVVSVTDEARNFIGQAFYSDRSQISLRFLTLTRGRLIAVGGKAKIRECSKRRVIPNDTNAYRLVYSEGDLLPSLIVDRYSDVFVLQTLSQGADAIKSLIVETLIDEFAPRAIIERNDARVRQLEGLPLISSTLYGSAPRGV